MAFILFLSLSLKAFLLFLSLSLMAFLLFLSLEGSLSHSIPCPIPGLFICFSNSNLYLTLDGNGAARREANAPGQEVQVPQAEGEQSLQLPVLPQGKYSR